MPIPPDMRLCQLPAKPPQTVEALRDAIAQYLESIDLGIVPLRRLGARFNGHCSRMGTTLNEVLSSLAAEGRCAVRFFQGLNRTYVMSESNYAAIFEENDFDWDKYAQALVDVK